MNFAGVEKGTWVRTIVLMVTIINLLLRQFGFDVLPFTEEEVGNAISVVLVAISSIVAWWKNNSFTGKAQAADRIMRNQ